MRQIRKTGIALLLAAAMLVSSFPVPAQAAGNAEGASGYAAGIGEEPGPTGDGITPITMITRAKAIVEG